MYISFDGECLRGYGDFAESFECYVLCTSSGSSGFGVVDFELGDGLGAEYESRNDSSERVDMCL